MHFLLLRTFTKRSQTKRVGEVIVAAAREIRQDERRENEEREILEPSPKGPVDTTCQQFAREVSREKFIQ